MFGIGSGVPGRLRERLALVLVTLLGLAFVLSGVLVLGKLAKKHPLPDNLDAIAFSAIDCKPVPPQGDNTGFLGEVRYQAQLPPKLQLSDKDLKARLERAFAGHSWVEKVEKVEIRQGGVTVHLLYRTPVLAVKLPGRTPLVDRNGIVMRPIAGADVQVPVFAGKVVSPAGPDGTAWGNSDVEAAAKVAGCLQQCQDCLHVTRVEIVPEGVAFETTSGARIKWGHPPGAESDNEARAEDKLVWLQSQGAPIKDGVDLRRISGGHN